MPVVYGAGNFGETFDLGRAYSQAENIKGARQDQELRGLQIEGSRIALEEAKKPKALTFEEQLNNTKMLHMAASAIVANPAAAGQWLPRLQQAGIMRPDFSLDGLAPEQIQTAAQGILEETTAALKSVEAAEKPDKPPTELQMLAARGVDITDPKAVDAALLAEDDRKASRAAAGAPKVNVTLPGGFKEDAASTEFSKIQGQQFASVLERGRLAQDELDVWNTVRQNPAVTGPTQDFRASLQAFAKDLGIPIAAGQLAQITNLAQYRAAANDLVLRKQLMQKGPQTESDARRIENAVANTKNIREANDLIVRYSIEVKKREIEMAAFYDEYRTSTNKLDGADGRWREYARTTPISKPNKSGRMVFQSEFMDAARSRGFSDEAALNGWRKLQEGKF